MQKFYYAQRDKGIANCVRLSPEECAEYLLWARANERKTDFDFAMNDTDVHRLSSWWGIKIAKEFDFSVVLCGHYGEIGDDFECSTLDNIYENYRYDEDVCECPDESARRVKSLGKFIGAIMNDHDGNPESVFCETTPDMVKWLTDVKGYKTVLVIP